MDERRRTRAEGRAGLPGAGRRAAAVAAVLAALAVGAGGCRSAGPPPAVGGALPILGAPPFAVGLQPTRAASARIGEPVGLRLSSSEAGYGNLYLINVDGSVMALAENLPLAPGVAADYPRPGDGVELRASPPAGVERLILLVTLQPFAGLGVEGGRTFTRPASLAPAGGADAFVDGFGRAVRALPAGSWASAEAFVQVIE